VGTPDGGPLSADVAVIGAGALGLSTALHCALRNRSVVVVERFTAGSQASGRAAGLFKSVQPDLLRTQLARRSIQKVISFEEWAGVPVEVRRSGSMMVARTDRHKAFLRTELNRSRGWGVDLREVSPAELGDQVSYYEPSGAEESVWCPEDVYIEEPASLVQAYLAACRLHGVQILESERAVSVLVPGGRVAGLETGHRRIQADIVVDAAGAWARQVGELAAARVAVAPVRHQLFITGPAPDVRGTDPITRVIDAAAYLRPARGGLMFGAFEPEPLPVDPRRQPAPFTTDDVPLDLGVLRERASQVAREAPLAAGCDLAEHRGGMFTMSPDGCFIVGPVPAIAGLWVITGCNGSGFSSSPALGEMLATWMTDDGAPPGAEALCPARFGVIGDETLIARGVWQYAHYYDPLAA
jgi:glycine/D-amino acid oxidase-like deaminating enzyme